MKKKFLVSCLITGLSLTAVNAFAADSDVAATAQTPVNSFASDWIASHPHAAIVLATQQVPHRLQLSPHYGEQRYGWAEIQALRAFQRMN